MRITRELLLKFARETIKQRLREEPDLHAAYLMGSVLKDAPLLGGTTDIDLVLVHKYQAPIARECLPLTPDISLDIYHKIQADYQQQRQLREDAHLGYPLTHNHIVLFDTHHWLEFIQSSVSADFHRADIVIARVNGFLDAARESWLSLFQTPPPTHTLWLEQYLKILELAVNAVAGLTGPPLTPRRFVIDFSERAENLGVPKIVPGFYGLLGFNEALEDQFRAWVNAFESDLTFLAENGVPPIHLAPCRHSYYLAALRSFLQDKTPSHASWLLLRTWLDIIMAAPQPLPGVAVWEACLETLNLTQESTTEKIEALDAFLDTVELLVETWATTYGA